MTNPSAAPVLTDAECDAIVAGLGYIVRYDPRDYDLIRAGAASVPPVVARDEPWPKHWCQEKCDDGNGCLLLPGHRNKHLSLDQVYADAAPRPATPAAVPVTAAKADAVDAARYRWITDNAEVIFHEVQRWALPTGGYVHSQRPGNTELGEAIDAAIAAGAE